MLVTDGMRFNCDGTAPAHRAAHLTNVPRERDSPTELILGRHFYKQKKTEQSSVFMASAACMMVHRKFFEELGGFDDRLALGYKDVVPHLLRD
jgi:GT2 family glycosyltransferase